ncbi:MAG: roadblock/LC7 domain-containing protein [Verrucomicrobia bacterium]|nr:roadblock/LC7 domain-containing protein [Verrucomicrobiota bacterium]
MAAPVSESPALETPVAAADTTVENTIRLALAPILRSLPNSFLSHVDAADFVEDAAQVSLPLDLITPQLAYGRVSVTREVFEAGLPAQHRGILASADAPAEIPLPLQEIFQNLPMGALSQRQDQVLEEVRPTIPTPFSQKAEEDAKALLAAQPPAALETEPAHEPSSTAPDQPEATTEPVPHAEPTATLQLLTEKEDEIAPAQAEEHSTVGAAPARAEMTETPAAGSIEPVPISTPQLEPPHREESTVESPVEPEGAVPSAEPVLADTADAGLAAASSLQESEAAASRESHPVAAFAPNEHPVPHEAPVSDESSTAAAPSSEIEPPLAPVMAEEMAPTGFAVEASDTLPPAASAATEPELPQAPPHAPVPTLPADEAASQNARREQAQEALREVFMIEDDLDAKKVVKLASQLPGLKGCVVMFADGLKLAGSVAADQESAGFCAMAPAFFQKARHFSREMNLGDLRDVTLHTERGLLLSFFMHEDICLCVAQAGRGFLPGVREKLQIVTRELAALYAKQH